MDLNIKIKDGKFHFGIFGKRDSFPFSIIRMPDKSINVSFRFGLFDKRDSFNFSIVRMPDKSSNVPFHFGLFDKRDSFPFSIVRMPDKSSNVPSSIVYSAIGAESLRIARASNSPETFSTVIEPLIAHMRGRGYPLEK